MIRPKLIVMLKEPCPGRVKTRLGRDIGMIQAAWWFRHHVKSVLRTLYAPRRWDMMLAVSPDVSGMSSRVWPRHLPRIPQGEGDLGARMLRLLHNQGPGPVCVIGGDIPGINLAHIARAFAALRTCDAVFAPACDGGYWLVGMRGIAPRSSAVFQNVRWSTEYALSDSIATLAGRRIALVDVLDDIDTAEDLRRLKDVAPNIPR